MSLDSARDIAIVVLAVESIIIGIVLVLLLWQVRQLVSLLQREVKPILDSAKQTLGTVKGTTSIVSETVVSPAIQMSSLVAGGRRAVRVAFSSDTSARRSR